MKIKKTLELHKLWLADDDTGVKADFSVADLRGSNLRKADLREADLCWADLSGANLSGANLRGTNLSGANLRGTNLSKVDLRYTTGNMKEVKSAQFDKWVCVWYNDPAQGTILNIGCQSHKLELWVKSNPRWIDTLDREAVEWWAKYRDVLLKLIEISMSETKE